MPREGTRSQTGHSAPRVFPVVDTAPTVSRKRASKPKAKKPAAASAKPAGVSKKKAPAKKEGGVAKKAKTAAKKVEKKVEKKVNGAAGETEKDAKPKTTVKK